MTATTPTSAPPLNAQPTPVAWLQKNLFNGWFNSALTIVLGAILAAILWAMLRWATTEADWRVIPANLPLYFVGRYPADQRWRIWVIVGIISILSGLTWGNLARNVSVLFSRTALIVLGIAAALAILTPTPLPFRLLILGMILVCAASAWAGRLLARKIPGLGLWISLAWTLSFFVVMWLLSGGLGLEKVVTNNWTGLSLTLFLAITSMVLSFPLGVLLALGRQSSLPVIRWFSVIYIELIRGVPLISILFMGQVVLTLFLPPGTQLDRVLRAVASLTIFTAAYVAENVRGGLQAIPRGQTEAAYSLGLNTPLTTAFIVLPQALKISIPSNVGQFISLFQDTTLVSIVGLLELLGISRSVVSNPEFLGRQLEVYLFIGVIYWFFCYVMSLGSRKLEKKLHTGH